MATPKRRIKTGTKSTPSPVAVPSRRKIKTRPAEKATKPAPKRAQKATVPGHDASRFHTVGASGAVRTSAKLSPVVLDRIPGKFTARDEQFIRDLKSQFGGKPFERRNFDAGLMSRNIGNGLIRHVSGDLAARDAVFALTSKAVAGKFN